MKIQSTNTIASDSKVCVYDCDVQDGFLQGDGRQLADVDIDYQADRRIEVKEYLEKRYNEPGAQRVFSAGTFSTMKLKAALKDVARVHKVPVNVVNYITAIFEHAEMTWTDLFKLAAVNKRVRKFILDYPQVIEDIRLLLGQPRSASIHASAILITPETLDGENVDCFAYVPIKKVDNLLVSELDGYSLDDIGLLKNDVLATIELTKIQTVIGEVNRVFNAGISFEGIVASDLDDPKAYHVLAQGWTQNVFQFSSRGMTKYLQDMNPTCIKDLIAANALHRPATLESGAAEKYLLCKHGEVAPVYLWGTYEALKDTYGNLIFQEQVSQIVREVGGFSLAEGVRLLKLISKKKIDVIHAMKEKFMDNARIKGCPKEDAVQIWELIESAGTYLFNKSHATAYAVTSYVGAWLKANYATAFYNVALQFADDKDIPLLMSEMEQSSTAKIVPPDINVSGVEFFTDYATDEIFWSLTRIKMVGVKTSQYIIDEREKNGPYHNIENFIHRLFRYKLKKYSYWDDPDNAEEAIKVPVNARHVRNLILAGCFDRLEGIGANTDRYDILCRAAKELGFALSSTDYPEDNIDKHYFWSIRQIEVSGIGSIDYRRIYDNSEARKAIKGRAGYMTLAQVLDFDNEGRKAAVCATVIEVTELAYTDKQTGERKRFCKLMLQQNNDLVELVCWSEYYMANRELISTLKDKIIIVTAQVRYNDYSGTNSLNTYNTSFLTNV